MTPEQIEVLNAHGPYNHGVWRAGDIAVTHEEALAGRADFIAGRAREAIRAQLTDEDLAGASVLDVGCYDGWLLEQGLGDLPFARRVGVEPRQKNIDKGIAVRQVLGLPTVADYRLGTVEALGSDQFDVVLCTGLIHHLESPGPALRALRRATTRLLFLETIVLPSRHLTPELQHDLEMKDVVYKYMNGLSGVTGQKFESSYYDGSADVLGVVSIPTVESLTMHLAAAGFEDIVVLADPESYGADGANHRRWAGTCITAKPGPPLIEKDWIADYELGMARTTLPLPLISRLFALVGTPELAAAVIELDLPDDRHGAEIVRNLRHNPEDKVRLEYGKAILHDDPKQAIEVLLAVTRRLNADWRATYRSFWALAEAYELLGDIEEAARQRDLLVRCNPRFPT